MKAIVCTKYGPPEVLQIREVKKSGKSILGFILSGEVEKNGDRVIQFTQAETGFFERFFK